MNVGHVRPSWQTRFNLFRKPISQKWHVGLGIASVVTFLIVYTLASYFVQSPEFRARVSLWAWHFGSFQAEDVRDDKGVQVMPNYLLPGWSQLWTMGVLPALTPEAKGKVDPSEAEIQAIKDEGRRLDQLANKPDTERLREEDQRLRAIAAGLSGDKLRAEVTRMRAITTRLLFDTRKQLSDDQAAVMDKLPSDVRGKAEAGLKKIEEEAKRAEDARIIWHVRLWEDIKATFSRLFLGLAISVLVSLILGVLMGCYAPVEAYLYPPMAVLAKIPGTVMLSLFMVIAGLNWKFYQSMILFGMIPTLTQTFYVYTKEVPEELLYKARTLGASQMECIFSVILPNILPKVVESIRLSVGPALIFLFAAELMFGNEGEGLGCTLRLVQKKGLIATPTAYFYLVCIAFFGFAIDYALRWSQRKLFPWYYAQ